ncbi:unnamed protein product [Cylicostephanus goldi]|uniref:BBS7 beta-propeller domain-containing protein n=1 Tax=Cylicostephanus goldi TaxID=71465 RepID=A0A3P6SP79_CYLGO|nr:unnamed protein product [Cylicostephanus goldi]
MHSGHTKQLVLYGTRDGRLGLIDLKPKQGDIKWEINTKSTGELRRKRFLLAITAITCYHFTHSDHPDILIGKDDGAVEIYVVDSEDNCTFAGSYLRINRLQRFEEFFINCDESITSIGCGRITREDEEEIVICTYTGWLFALAQSKGAASAVTPKAASVNVKVQQLRSEIEELETKLNEERTRYGELTKKGGNQAAYIPTFQIHDSFEFSPQHNAYSLTIELVLPIDFIIVQVRILEGRVATKIRYISCNLFVPWKAFCMSDFLLERAR